MTKQQKLRLLNEELRRNICKTEDSIWNASEFFNAIDNDALHHKSNKKLTKCTLSTPQPTSTNYYI